MFPILSVLWPYDLPASPRLLSWNKALMRHPVPLQSIDETGRKGECRRTAVVQVGLAYIRRARREEVLKNIS